jgi:hypothetical protein
MESLQYNQKVGIKKYKFKEDYHFDNDVYGVRQLGAEVYQWVAKKGDIVFGVPNETIKGYVTLHCEKEGLISLSKLTLIV